MASAYWVRVAAAGALAAGAPAAHAQRLADLRPAVAVAPAEPDGGVPPAPGLPAPRHAAVPDTARPAPPAPRGDRRTAHARRGALIGAVLGVGVALFMDAQLAEPGARTSNGSQLWTAVAVCGAVGAAVGGVVGVLIP